MSSEERADAMGLHPPYMVVDLGDKFVVFISFRVDLGLKFETF